MPDPKAILEQIETSTKVEGVDVLADPMLESSMNKLKEILYSSTANLVEVATAMPSQIAKLAQVGKLKDLGRAQSLAIQSQGLDREREEPNR